MESVGCVKRARVEAHPTISPKKDRVAHSMVGDNNVHIARDVDGIPLWWNWMVIRACRPVLSIFWDPNPLHDSGAVARTLDASAVPITTIWSKAAWWIDD